MATDREKFLKGIRFMAVGFPFIFMGPALLTWLGIPAYHKGNYVWLAISIVLMLTAAFFCVKGLRTILASLFDGDKKA
jgi:apolipoprotein N-acyltransferase